MLTGSLEAYVVAWVWGWKETKARTGFACAPFPDPLLAAPPYTRLQPMPLLLPQACADPRGACRSAAAFTGGFTVASLVGTILAGGLHHTVDSGINIAIGAAVGFFIFFASALAAFFLRSDKAMPFGKWFEIVVWAGTRNLRCTFKKNPKRWETIVHIISFDFMVKYICFPALLGLFINQAVNDAVNFENGCAAAVLCALGCGDRSDAWQSHWGCIVCQLVFGGSQAANACSYGDYPTWVHVVAGIVVLGIMFFFLVVFVVWPGFWDSLGGPESEEDQKRIYTNKVCAPRLAPLPQSYLCCERVQPALRLRHEQAGSRAVATHVRRLSHEFNGADGPEGSGRELKRQQRRLSANAAGRGRLGNKQGLRHAGSRDASVAANLRHDGESSAQGRRGDVVCTESQCFEHVRLLGS